MKTSLTSTGTLVCLAARHLELEEHYRLAGDAFRAAEQRVNLAVVREEIQREIAARRRA